MTKFIMQMQPLFGEEEKRAVCDYMDEGGFITEYKRTQLFEEMIADFVGSKHCIVVNNGTISLTLAAMAVGIKAGDEVLVPNFTMIATAAALKMFGAVPVFVDVDRDTLCMNLDAAAKAITNKTKAIMLVAANGRFPSSGIEGFECLAKNNNLVLLEDSAQALGSYYPDGRHIGRVGAIGSFSFSAPKIISTGQGGALITDDDDLNRKIRRLKDFGRASGGNDIHDSIGFNSKFTELQACVGIEQMKKLIGRVTRKKAIWRRYADHLAGIKQIQLFDHDLNYTVPWFVDCLAEQRDALMAWLKEEGIGTRPMYSPMNRQKAISISGSFPVSELVGREGLWLPSAIQLLDEDIDNICGKIKSFYAT